LYAFAGVVATSTRKFFVEAGIRGDPLQQLEDAWLRTVLLHVTL